MQITCGGTVIQFAACLEGQTTSEQRIAGFQQGAATYAFREAIVTYQAEWGSEVT